VDGIVLESGTNPISLLILLLLLLLLLGRRVFGSVVTNRVVRMKFGGIFIQVIIHRLTESYFWYNFQDGGHNVCRSLLHMQRRPPAVR